MKKLLEYALLISILGVLAWSAKSGVQKDAYERGAWAILMHHKCVGNYGSQTFRDIAFGAPDLQTCEDIQRLRQQAKQSEMGCAQ